MFLTKTKLNKLIQAALEAQFSFEKQHPEPYDREQRVEAVTQRTEKLLGNRPAKLKEEVRRGVETIWPSGGN